MIKLVRIDYRLLHGRGFARPERWISTISSSPTPKPRRMPSLRCRLTAKPAGVTLDIATVEQAAEKLNSGKLDHKKSWWSAILRKPSR